LNRHVARVLIVFAFLIGSLAGLEIQPATGGMSFMPASAQASDMPQRVAAALVADTTAVVPGKPFKLGVDLKMDPGWHTYYKVSGEAGRPTEINWDLPKGFKASELLWQKPQKFVDAGITTYGYLDRTLVGATITAPANLKPGAKLTFTAHVTWLVCKDLCMPGEQKLSITLPVGETAQAANSDQFSKLGFNGAVSSIKGGAASLGATAGSTDGTGDGSPTVGSGGREPANGGQAQFTGDILATNLKVQGAGHQHESLLVYLGLALVGGFILNFMPCVLPVISIKVLSFMQQAGDDPKKVFKLGLTFSAGIISSFMVLAGLVAGIQAAGQKIGWGFQFQFPLFLLVMSAVVLVFALSLFGLVYFQVNAGQNEIDKLAQKEGVTGTFFKGVLATTLSTPCSAPFLGTALGFAFSQPVWVIALIFFTIGLGMASPYIVLTAKPDWMKYLPKPGVWMEKFKESMGFLLLATVIWLLWVLGQQVGLNAAMAAAAFLVALSFAVWLVGRFVNLTSTGKRKTIVYSVAGASMVASYVAFLMPFPQLLSFSPAVQAEAGSSPPVASSMGSGSVPNPGPGPGSAQASPLTPVVSVQPVASKEGIAWQPFTIDTLNQQLSAGKTVFVDFTADWCLTCKVNEATVVNTQPVIAKMKELNVVTLRADWTRQDPVISKLLQKFGRSGVPLYVIFPGNRPTEPIVLPEVITQDLVVQQLAAAGPGRLTAAANASR